MTDREVMRKLVALLGRRALAEAIGVEGYQATVNISQWASRRIPPHYRRSIRLLANRKLGAQLPEAWAEEEACHDA